MIDNSSSCWVILQVQDSLNFFINFGYKKKFYYATAKDKIFLQYIYILLSLSHSSYSVYSTCTINWTNGNLILSRLRLLLLLLYMYTLHVSSINPNAVNGFLANPCSPNEDYIVHAHAVILMLVTFIFVTNCLQSLNISFTVLILTMKHLLNVKSFSAIL